MIENIKTLLTNKNKTISVAESLTGGNLQAYFSSINGSSKFYLGGITAYNIDIKKKFFDIDYEAAKKCDCVSEEVAITMATSIANLMNSDYSISTTGFAVPNDTISVPYAYICFYSKSNNIISCEKVIQPFSMSRIDFQKYLVSYIASQFIKFFENLKDEHK